MRSARLALPIGRQVEQLEASLAANPHRQEKP